MLTLTVVVVHTLTSDTNTTLTLPSHNHHTNQQHTPNTPLTHTHIATVQSYSTVYCTALHCTALHCTVHKLPLTHTYIHTYIHTTYARHHSLTHAHAHAHVTPSLPHYTTLLYYSRWPLTSSSCVPFTPVVSACFRTSSSISRALAASTL